MNQFFTSGEVKIIQITTVTFLFRKIIRNSNNKNLPTHKLKTFSKVQKYLKVEKAVTKVSAN